MSKIIKEAIENTIGGNGKNILNINFFKILQLNTFFFKNKKPWIFQGYQHDKVNHWTKTVVDNCLGVLTKLQKPYKYIGKINQRWIWFSNNKIEFGSFILVTCMIMQKNGAGLHTASSCYWNNETDGSCTVSQFILINEPIQYHAWAMNHTIAPYVQHFGSI